MAATILRANCHYPTYLNKIILLSCSFNLLLKVKITDIICNLKTTKPCDSFVLPVTIINKCVHNIAGPITHLVNQSFLTGIVNRAIKIANISPIFKLGDLQDMTNFRTIAKLCCFSNILERAMHNRLSDFLDSNNIL